MNNPFYKSHIALYGTPCFPVCFTSLKSLWSALVAAHCYSLPPVSHKSSMGPVSPTQAFSAKFLWARAATGTWQVLEVVSRLPGSCCIPTPRPTCHPRSWLFHLPNLFLAHSSPPTFSPANTNPMPPAHFKPNPFPIQSKTPHCLSSMQSSHPHP